MTFKHSCVCDFCDKDLSVYTANYIDGEKGLDYRLSLKSEMLPPSRYNITSLNIAPEIKNVIHFCDFTCMKKYLNTKEYWNGIEI